MELISQEQVRLLVQNERYSTAKAKLYMCENVEWNYSNLETKYKPQNYFKFSLFLLLFVTKTRQFYKKGGHHLFKVKAIDSKKWVKFIARQ